MAPVVGLIGVIVIISLIVASYSPILGSVANDAQANNITNSSHNVSYEVGTGVAQGFMGFSMAQVGIIFILLVIVVLLLIWKL